MSENINKPTMRSRASDLLQWLKRNKVNSFWLVCAGGWAALLEAHQSVTTSLFNCMGAAGVALALSVYYIFYLWNGPNGLPYLKRSIPLLICGLLLVGLHLLHFALPNFLLPGMDGFLIGLWLTALFVTGGRR